MLRITTTETVTISSKRSFEVSASIVMQNNEKKWSFLLRHPSKFLAEQQMADPVRLASPSRYSPTDFIAPSPQLGRGNAFAYVPWPLIETLRVFRLR